MRHSFSVRSRRSLATFVALAAVAGVAPVLTAGTALAAGPQPWTAGAKVTGADAVTDVQDLVVSSDGSAVALWNQRRATETGTERVLYAAVRPAGGDVWAAAAPLAVTPTATGAAKLVAAGDAVVAVWTEYPDATDDPEDRTKPAARIMSAVLSGGTWSEPTTVMGLDAQRETVGMDLTAAADGTVTAVWSDRPLTAELMEIRTATRAADGTWSPAVRVSRAPEAGGEDAYGGEVAVDAAGNTVIAFSQVLSGAGTEQVHTVVRPAGGTAWGTPVGHTGPLKQSTAVPRLAAGADGTVAMTWSGLTGDMTAGKPLLVSTTKDAAAGWTLTQAALSDGVDVLPDPLVGPGGAISLVWRKDPNGGSTLTVSRPAGASAWSEPQALSTGPVPKGYDGAVGKDGSVHVVWGQQTADGGEQLVQAARTGGGWTPAAPLQNGTAAAFDAEVAVGADGVATAAWSGTALWAARSLPQAGVVTSTVPATASLTGVTGSTTPVWKPVWDLDRPVSGWTLTLTDPAGAVARTLTDGTRTTRIAPVWNGLDAAGRYAANGPLKWTLKATTAGAATPATLATGTLTVTGGTPGARDHGSASATPDGTGDALVLTTNGGIRSVYGDRATGRFNGTATGYGWPAGIRPVPIGDMNGDRCNDLLVRNSAGELRRYTPACGKTVTPSTTNKPIGTGWNQYDVLTSPGDVTGDRRADLVARNASTGALYLYERLSTGVFAARVQIPGAYKAYKKVLGAGDLNGDGHGDLVLHDTGNELWRMNGLGGGRFAAPVKIATDWGTTTNALVAAGDLNGDGRADLISRDTSGTIWRHSGTGKGTFASRVQIATGWQVYSGLF
ncbi:FG-GAP repeat domain-containing protein [Streptomyces sp. NPDC101132]|uniref:FG-GAP repeat domain-containing protein n=1 Tax=Streptomyces sp. NPDC101132 TaxID=3366110 RepID=UPI0037F21DB5